VCRRHSYAGRGAVVLAALGGDLPRFGLGELVLQVLGTSCRIAIGNLALHKQAWLASVCDDKIDFSPVAVAIVVKRQVVTEGILAPMHPLQQVAGDKILELRPRIRNDRPVEVEVLGFLLHRSAILASQRRQRPFCDQDRG